ncbi:MAG: winged helix-turn-helix transcriptional regulator [Chloroflexi bacterium]|nr:winged helix-turn-helix transcriptional regulator [Chloroflexota bacterium]
MPKRSYQQYCPTAYSLDVVGDRWTLLIVRDLLFGPRRYTDLLEGLPGIGTNLLANRLKEMEAAEVVRKTKLPPPASSTVYELAERGRQLAPIVMILTDWGLELMPGYVPEEDEVPVVPCLGAMTKLFVGDSAEDMTVEFHINEEVYVVRIEGGQMSIQPGTTPDADLVVYTTPRALMTMLVEHRDPATYLENGEIEIRTGDVSLLKTFTGFFQHPSAA